MPRNRTISRSAWPAEIHHLGGHWLQMLASSPGSDRPTIADLLSIALSETLGASNASSIGVIAQSGKRWAVDPAAASTPGFDSEAVPESLILQALESGWAFDENGWAGAAMGDARSHPRCLVVKFATSIAGGVVPQPLVIGVAELLELVLQMLARQGDQEAERHRLRTMLRIAATWQQQQDWGKLLESMAAAATELLGAERASLFLWDRRRKLLVGRPALGVEGGQLEVDDSAGIVGAVLSSGQPKRWDSTDNESEVNRTVDRKLKFETRSLVAVPLLDRSGRALGVFEVINKLAGRFTADDQRVLTELAVHASAAIENSREREQLAKRCDTLADAVAENVRIIGESPPIVAVRKTADRVAKTDLAVMILGENGTGKEVLARSIHLAGQRRREPFIAVNCAALVETLLESELFGHEKGAFTDAHEARAGKFEIATGGTLFLDEIGDMSLSGQAKLLRVLEEKVITRVGGSTPIPTDVRVIAATNQPLAELVREHRFREDLFFRLNVVTIELPPLRHRGQDIIMLAEHFLQSFAHQLGRKQQVLSPGAAAALARHHWPGNIRELRNLIERVSALCPNDTIEDSDLAFSTSTIDDDRASDLSHQPLVEATRQFQIRHIEDAIQRAGRNMTEAAGMLGLHRSNLYRKMKQLGMDDV